MPKDKTIRSSSFNRSRVSPYPCCSKNADTCKSKVPLVPLGDEKEWEDASCPICMDYPHNAVLLLCSSLEKGCRPYVCDTSYRHSNCFDQYRKSSAAAAETTELLEAEVPSSWANHRGEERHTSSLHLRSCGKQKPKLVCPLCRGQIDGWVVIEPARRLMNKKSRNCSLESCNFTGNYSELRRHARHEHSSAFPSEVDPKRKQDWTRLEHETDFQDLLNAYHMEPEDDWSYDNLLYERDWMMMEHERELEDILGEMFSESADAWDENSHLLTDSKHDFTSNFLELCLLDPYFESIEFDDPRVAPTSQTGPLRLPAPLPRPSARPSANISLGCSWNLPRSQQHRWWSDQRH